MSHSPFRSSEHIERVELPYNGTSSLQSGRLTIESVGINGRSAQPTLSESRIIDTSAKNTVVVKGVKKKFACHICGKEYNTRQYVKQHVRCVHKKENQEGHLVTINNKTQLTQVTTNGQQVTPRGQETQVCTRQFSIDLLHFLMASFYRGSRFFRKGAVYKVQWSILKKIR